MVRTSQGADRPNATERPDPRLKKACADFEALLVKQLLATAHIGESDGGLFEADAAEQTLSDLRLDSLASALTAGKGLGVAAVLERQLMRGRPHPAAARPAGGTHKS